MTPRIDRQLRALEVAKQCASMGARVRTIEYLTGLPPRDVLQLLFPDRLSVPRGRPPDSPEWYHTANLLYRAEASILISIYCRLRNSGFSAAEGLVGAYRHYAGICNTPQRISFDRGFDLAAHTDGLWLTTERSFSIVTCPACGSDYLVTYGGTASSDDCPFCRLLQRYNTDQRIQTSFPTHPLMNPEFVRLGTLALLQKDGAN